MDKLTHYNLEAHRGAEKPGNMMQSFQKAIDCGYDSIELDIFLTKDDQIAVLHGFYGEDLGIEGA